MVPKGGKQSFTAAIVLIIPVEERPFSALFIALAIFKPDYRRAIVDSRLKAGESVSAGATDCI